MPGFPLALVTTDVLQEGEDLHTFCSRVIHYGITWTPSAMEQRTGRIDRIGSLFQRAFDGLELEPSDSDWIQVYYLCYWEKMWCHAMLLQWDQAAHFAQVTHFRLIEIKLFDLLVK